MDSRWKIFRVVGLGLGVALRKIVLWHTALMLLALLQTKAKLFKVQ